MMKRGAAIILAIVILAGLVLVLTGRRSPFGKRNTSFASSPEKEITRIVLSGSGRELKIENNNGRWLLNGNSETRKSSVGHLLRILKEMSIKSPVSPELFDSLITKTGIKPVRVKTFENRKILSDFLVYKTASNIYGNIMKKSERAKPFIVYVPGNEANIGSAFTMNELYWLPYTIFNLLPSEIVSVGFVNFADPGSSFSIKKEGKTFELTDDKTIIQDWDTALVGRYLTYFTFIPFESWALDMNEEERNRIVSATPAYRIDVKTSEKEIVLSLWERRNADGTIDSDRLYGKTADNDQLFIVRYFDIDPILKKKDYFLKPE